MRFDDRLKTVLDTPVGDPRDRAVRWRQLVDLLSRARGDSDPVLIGRAIQAARDDRSSVADTVRAATARSIAGRPLDPRLIALFASDLLEVAAPLLAGATLDEDARREVAASASDEVRRFFFALEGPAPVAPAAEVIAPPAIDDTMPSIEEAVERIEKLRRARAAEIEAQAAPVEPEASAIEEPRGEVALFRWESDALGAIAWVEGAPRGALIGRALAGHAGEALLSEECRDLVARRAPFADVPLASAEPFGGEWRVSGAPAFAPGDGRFIGYRGIARRIDLSPSQRAAVPRAFEGADTLREMIHEIRTPLNAIIGFAEIIDGQYLGPAHRRYRERAGEIVAHARELLGAIEDLDFAARLQAGRGASGDETADVGTILTAAIESLGEGGVGLSVSARGRGPRAALSPALAERLVGRLLGAVLVGAEDKEALRVEVASSRGRARIGVSRPTSLAGRSAEQLFDAAAPAGGGPASAGFALRLVRGLARIAGGGLEVEAERLVLSLPLAR